jgi:hypothetical protein
MLAIRRRCTYKRSMPNVKPIKYATAMTIRIDGEFIEALDELRALLRPVPSKSDAIRRAVFEMLKRERRK